VRPSNGQDRSARILYFPQSAGYAVRSSGPMTRSDRVATFGEN
jgi:hypothetical protein